MAVAGSLSFALALNETSANDLGTATMPHALAAAYAVTSGTTDNKMDLIYSDNNSLVATTVNIDVRGALSAALGGTSISMVEVRLIIIKNKGTTVLTLGNGTNPAWAGLFGGTAHTLSIPPGLFVWYCTTDGIGLQTTAATADILKLDSGASTVEYDIVIGGVSA